MEIKDFQDYTVAQITEKDIQSISQLEKNLSDDGNKDIVLIAYQPRNRAENL